MPEVTENAVNLEIPELASRKILVLDDSELQLKIHVNILQGLGAEDITTVGNGQEGLELAKNQQFTLVVSDWQMPGMSGSVFMQKLKEMEGYTQVPFLICSGDLSDKDIFLAVEFGINNYLVKPFNAQRYHERLVGMIGKNKKINELEARLGKYSANPLYFFLIN